jgi:glycine cleavage system H protein
VALDRTYSTDHVWVKTLNNNTVQIGMSDPFQILADRVKTLYLSPPGTKLTVQAAFGYIEADKLSVDLISPVSGTILTTNTPLMAIPGPINSDPYGTGWMLTIQLTAPAELQNLVAPRYYAYLESGKNWTGPVPPMH